VQALNAQSRSIDSYLDRGGEDQLHRSERTLEALREEYSGVDIDKQEIARGVQELRKSRDNHNNVRRTMQDNLNYRNDKKQLKEFEAAIRELESHDAEKDYRTWNNESTAQQNVRNTLNAEQATLVGIIKSKDDQLKGLIQDWNTDFKDAAYKYREAHVKVEATKAVVEDLGRYGGALDKAIMKYHSMKMEEINRIIEELWKRTYQGTDVDTVSIRSDNETGKGNKSYNYRVCMVKQDVEMDMRGRCSAGQKVLACIIIRLALAECFGVACGLIALDEPTTNLDRENIKALAISLHGIIKERRRQSNFQLIIITHDEEFLRNMQCSDFCERYYRVSRDVRQKSIIERQDISLVSSRSCKMWRRLLILCRSWSKRCDTDDDMVYEIRERKILGDSAGERFVLLAYNDEADRIVGWLFPGIQ
jgi:DNA repair protein RAD50